MRKLLYGVMIALLMASVAFADVKEIESDPEPGINVDDPGPDMFGYLRIDVPAGWEFQEISGTGTFIVAGDDQFADYALTADFEFYGTDHAVTTPSTNGGVTFDGEYMNLTNACPLPDQNGIFVFNDDLVCSSGVYGEYFEVCPIDGGAGLEPCTIIMWDEVVHYGGAPGIWDMELVLFHTSKNIGMLFDTRFEQDGGGTTGIDQGVDDVNYCLTVICDSLNGPLPGTQYLIQHPDVIASETMSFSTLKAMYR